MPPWTDQPPIVGRDRERGILRQALEATRDGQGRTVFVVGEDGMGKSWLALDAAVHARSLDMLVLHGRASRTGPQVTLRPLAEALAGFLRAQPGQPRGNPCPDPLDPFRASPVALGEKVLRLLADAGKGCLLILEDLHDADPLTLAAAEYLADNLGAQGLVLLGTIRHEPGPAWDLAHLLAQRCSATLVPLAGFDRREVGLLAASYLDIDPVDMPREAVDRLWTDSRGNPFVARELLCGMVGAGLLVVDGAGCRFNGRLPMQVPLTVGRGIVQRAKRFGPGARQVLLAAAAIGERFPLAVLQRALPLSERVVRAHLRAAVVNGLIRADARADGWYVFAHPMTVAALRGQQTPADLAVVATRAVDAIRELHPDLPGEWCRFSAELSTSAGHPEQAAQLFARAAGRAIAVGKADVAADLLERAWESLDDTADANLRADVLSDLLVALAASGRVERGLRVCEAVEGLLDAGADTAAMATLHARLAWLAHVGGRHAMAMDQLHAARTMLGAQASEGEAAPVDAIEALLTADMPERAARAADRAESTGSAAVTCQAWLARGLRARSGGTGDSGACFGRALTLAAHSRLPLWRLYAKYLLAEEEWLTTGDTEALEQVDASARRMGAEAIHHLAIARCALDRVLRGDFGSGGRLADGHQADAQRLGLADAVRDLVAVRAVAAAHQGIRIAPDQVPPVAIGLADAVCSLLEENRERARRELAEAASLLPGQPASLPLARQQGLALFLAVLAGDGEPSYHDTAVGAASRWRWDRQFALLARAVLLGRCGRREEAMAAVVEAGQAAHAYPMTKHLGLRLVAEAAHADRWGDPAAWLQAAEAHFRDAGIAAVARACRSMLRRIGVVVPHRRSATGIPGPLRRMGVTEREYEVLRLLADRLDNRSIAGKLFISPRTVEKHVASLMLKTMQPRRAALSAYAAQFQRGLP